jgi:hypothetical protein
VPLGLDAQQDRAAVGRDVTGDVGDLLERIDVDLLLGHDYLAILGSHVA